MSKHIWSAPTKETCDNWTIHGEFEPLVWEFVISVADHDRIVAKLKQEVAKLKEQRDSIINDTAISMLREKLK